VEILLIPAAYLCGSLSISRFLVKQVSKEDLLETDQVWTGATRVSRKAGLILATFVAVFDVSKAFIPTYVAIALWPDKELLHILVAGAASLGHSRSIFLGFKGGKAVSTTDGGFFALAVAQPYLWIAFVPALTVFVGAILISRGLVSLGSLLGSLSGVLTIFVLLLMDLVPAWYFFGLLAGVSLIVIMHSGNIKRLIEGREQRTRPKLLW
jgi:glycerol-3-phosphate acyltransferase PlsY